MAKYLMIESRAPFTCIDVVEDYETAGGLAERGNDVAVFLTQNGVLAARRGSTAARRISTLASSAKVFVDDDARKARGITDGELVEGVTVAGADQLVDLLCDDGRKAFWR